MPKWNHAPPQASGRTPTAWKHTQGTSAYAHIFLQPSASPYSSASRMFKVAAKAIAQLGMFDRDYYSHRKGAMVRLMYQGLSMVWSGTLQTWYSLRPRDSPRSGERRSNMVGQQMLQSSICLGTGSSWPAIVPGKPWRQCSRLTRPSLRW